MSFDNLIDQEEYVANKVSLITMSPNRALEKKETLTTEDNRTEPGDQLARMAGKGNKTKFSLVGYRSAPSLADR